MSEDGSAEGTVEGTPTPPADTGGGAVETALAAAANEATPPAGSATSGSWLESLDPDYRANPSIAKFKSQNELARGYINAEKLVGAEKIPTPKDDWTDEDWSNFHSKLGRPDKVEDYDLGAFPPPAGLPSRVNRLRKAGSRSASFVPIRMP